MNANSQVLGIDIGGTNLRMGMVKPNGELAHFQRSPVPPGIRGCELVDWIANYLDGGGHSERVSAVGIGLAGILVGEAPRRPYLAALPGLEDYPLADEVGRRLGLPCVIDNDANQALRGEAHFGAAQPFSNVLLLTLGTGIGGGLLLNRRLHAGRHGSAVEIGPMLLWPSVNGSYAGFESLYSPGAIMRKLDPTRGLLFDQVRQGNPEAGRFAAEMIDALAWMVSNVHILLDLELTLISGGLAAVGEQLARDLEAAFRRICPAEFQFGLKIRMGGLPVDTAGVIGAACQWFELQGALPRL